MMNRLFWGPDPELCAELLSPAVREELAELAELLEPAGAEAARGLAAILAEARDADTLAEGLEPDYVRLFISGPGGVPAPLYQSCYQGEGLVMGPAARDMERRLAAEGLVREEKAGEPPDHLAIELEYLLWLFESDRAEDARDFAAQVMAPWLPELAARLADEPAEAFWPRVAALATSLIRKLA